MSNFEESCSIVNSLVSEADQGAEAEFLGKLDTINSGESKFKSYTFKQHTSQSPEAIKKCVDFWTFIESRKDIIPQGGFSLIKKAKNKPTKEPKVSWKDVLTLLKSKKLDKLASKPQPKVACSTLPSCSMQICVDDFEVTELNDFDPQKIILVDATTQTDKIYTADKAVQTDETPEAAQRRIKLAELDQLLKAIRDELTTGSIEEMVCVCSPVPSDASVKEQSSSNDVLSQSNSISMKDACICSCGEENCLCSLCLELLEKISGAQAILKSLSLVEMQKCPCSNIVCDCLYDYNELLNTKLQINRLVEYAASSIEAQSGLYVECHCSCGQLQCPCSIIFKLFHDLDTIIGHKPILKSDEDTHACTKQEDFKYHNCLQYLYSQINKNSNEAKDIESRHSSISFAEELLETCPTPNGLCLCITESCTETIKTAPTEAPIATDTNSNIKQCNCQNSKCLEN